VPRQTAWLIMPDNAQEQGAGNSPRDAEVSDEGESSGDDDRSDAASVVDDGSPSALPSPAASVIARTDDLSDGEPPENEEARNSREVTVVQSASSEEAGDCDSREEWEAAEWEEAREEWHGEEICFAADAGSSAGRHIGQAFEEEEAVRSTISRKRRGTDGSEFAARFRSDAGEFQTPHGGSTRSDHSFSMASMCDACPETLAATIDTLGLSDVATGITGPGDEGSGQNLQTPHSPGHGAWLTEPISIDAPLLSLDEEASDDRKEELARVREELAEARAASKADRAELDEAKASIAGIRRECEELRSESRVLRLQLQDHHGIMAADWAQTLGFQERLKQEETARERLAAEAAELRENILARREEVRALREDAAHWQLLTRSEVMGDATSSELDKLLEITVPAMARLQTETQQRSRAARLQLHSELEQQLCVVCRDARKTVLFLPCSHICVCEACRGRLHPYRCPMCQEPVQSYVGRVHF